MGLAHRAKGQPIRSAGCFDFVSYRIEDQPKHRIHGQLTAFQREQKPIKFFGAAIRAQRASPSYTH